MPDTTATSQSNNFYDIILEQYGVKVYDIESTGQIHDRRFCILFAAQSIQPF